MTTVAVVLCVLSVLFGFMEYLPVEGDGSDSEFARTNRGLHAAGIGFWSTFLFSVFSFLGMGAGLLVFFLSFVGCSSFVVQFYERRGELKKEKEDDDTSKEKRSKSSKPRRKNAKGKPAPKKKASPPKSKKTAGSTRKVTADQLYRNGQEE